MTTVQDDCGGARSNSIFSGGNRIESSAGLRIVTGLEVKDQFSYENDYAPKPRKPYTISKQRERWTEDEHKKFLEALKLFGRSWRMIEEHVGTKTAVQIRSHAQKFFSKVVRESSGCTSGPSEAIEIPPPRPKRKPMHPYPRKLVNAPVEASSNLELSRKSPILMDSAQENQSPTSVLSALGSDAFGSDSNSPNGSLSPDSSAAPVQRPELTLSHPCSSHEESVYPSSVPITTGSGPLEQSPTNIMRLGVSSQDFAEGVSAMEASSWSLKLFGTTILVTDSQRPSSRTTGTCKSFPTDANEGKPLQFLSVKVNHAESPSVGTVHSWRQMHRAGPGAICYTQCMDEGSNMGETDSGAHPPWFSYSSDMPFTVTPINHPQHSIHSNSNHEGGHDKEFQKEGSWTGSNSKSVNEDNFDKLPDIETQSCQRSLDQEEKGPDLAFELKPSENSAFSIIRTSADKHMKGFVPYKKRVADRDNQSATIIGTEREKQRLRSL